MAFFRVKRKRRFTWLMLTLPFLATPVAAAEFMGLGDLSGGPFNSYATAVSADGKVVVGRSAIRDQILTLPPIPPGYQAFRWSPAGGMAGLGYLPGGDQSAAMGVSADGTVVVGASETSDGNEGFRWTQDGGMVGLGYLASADYFSVAYGVSADGTAVVGSSDSGNGSEAFRWTEAGDMVGLGYLDGHIGSAAFDISADGTVVVGNGSDGNSAEAFRWTEGGGMTGLGHLGGHIGWFYAVAPVDGSCEQGPSVARVPIYRLYNNGFAQGIDSNHRCTPDLVTVNQMIRNGWIFEGVAFCARSL
jgi:probable HAF family extracellular repeat protein